MIKIGFAAILFFIVTTSYCQQRYFILIQSDNNQPFYARVGQKTFPSTSVGNLILAELKDSNYEIQVGFPKNQFPEQHFSVAVGRKDLAFRLRHLDEKGWVLLNMQNQEIKMPLKADIAGNPFGARGTKKEDPFSNLMAGVVNDTAVLYSTYVAPVVFKDSLRVDSAKQIAVKPDTSALAAIKKIGPATHDHPPKEPAKNGKKPVKTAARKPAPVEKLEEQNLNAGRRLVFLDRSKKGSADTIEVLIPLQQDSLASRMAADSLKKATVTADAKLHQNGISATNGLATDPLYRKQNADKTSSSKIVIVNSDCKSYATDLDVDRLRQRIVKVNNEKGKIALFKKLFKTKCLTTKQFKSLSDLFPSDEWRYKFFEAGFPFVSDWDNFPRLVQLLSEDEYIQQFNALISNH